MTASSLRGRNFITASLVLRPLPPSHWVPPGARRNGESQVREQFHSWRHRPCEHVPRKAGSLRGSVRRLLPSWAGSWTASIATLRTHAHIRARPLCKHGATHRGPVTCVWTNADIQATRACLSMYAQASPGNSRGYTYMAPEGEQAVAPCCVLSGGNCYALQADRLLLSPAPAGADGV